MLFVLLGTYANGQQQGAKVVAEIAAGNEKMVKNAPFSAEAVSESVQALADGNRIVRSSTSKLYRNSEGRFRRETEGGNTGLFGTHFSYGQGVSILDPVGGYRYMVDDYLKTARVFALMAGKPLTIAGTVAVPGKIVGQKAALTEQQRAEVEAKIAANKDLTDEQKRLIEKKLAEANSFTPPHPTKEITAEQHKLLAEKLTTAQTMGPITAVVAQPGTYAMTVGEGGFAGFYPGQYPKYDTRSEDLGARDFEGVSANGNRTITTIPAGAIGNERPIEITYERWYSKELEVVVYSKHSDPRFGDQTYTLKNIVRSEPDPSLFTVPNGYKIFKSFEPAGLYRLNTTVAPTPAQSASTPRPATVAPKPATVVNVKNTKP